MHDVVIVGGGLAGLLTAVELTRRGADVVVVERSPRPGGAATTVSADGYRFDPAVGSLLLPHPHLSRLLAAAGIDLVPADAAADTKLVHTRRGLVAAPRGPLGAISTPLVSAGGKVRTALEPFVARAGADDETLEATLARRLGNEAGHLAATLVAHGIVAGDPARLSTAALLPVVAELERSAGSLTRGMIRRLRARPRGAARPRPHVHPNGMAGVVDGLAAHLGARVACGWDVQAIERTAGAWAVHGPARLEARSVVLAVAPPVVRMLVPTLGPALGRFRSSPVAVVALGGRADLVPLPVAFGFLTAPRSPLHVLGVVFESRLAAGRAPSGHHLAKAIYGGDADPGILELADDELVELATRELIAALGEDVRPGWTTVVRHLPGIPQYGVGHLGSLSAVDALTAEMPDLHVAGWAYRGVGVTALASDAVRIADRIAASRPLGTNGPIAAGARATR